MLEAKARDGRGRTLDWTPSDGADKQRLPALIEPVTQRFAPSPECTIALVDAPGAAPAGAVEIVSDGTWFHPRGHEGDLVVRAPQPTQTSTVQIVPLGDDIAVWHDAAGWASNPRQTVPVLQHAVAEATPARALWAPGVGTPADYAVWAYLGVDLFDSSKLLLAAIKGTALTIDGPMPADELAAVEGTSSMDADALAAWNLRQAYRELRRVRAAIEAGTLRALAERRAAVSPESVALLRRFDAQHDHLAAATPVNSDAKIACHTQDSLWQPAVERYRRRIRDRYTPPVGADVLVILPCSAGKPYRYSKSHRYFARTLDDSGIRHRCHEVMITSPLGVVPRELEQTFPARNYDVPVTGVWTKDEEQMIRDQVAAMLANGDYRHVVCHVGPGTRAVIEDLLPAGTRFSAETPSPQSRKDCIRLSTELAAIKREDPQRFEPRMYNERKRADIEAAATWQFGAGIARVLAADAKAHGKTPWVKLIDAASKDHLAQFTDRGLISLSLAGGARVVDAGVEGYRVRIGDFWPRKTGSLFAAGVESADPEIAPGDTVIVVQPDGSGGERLVAVGLSNMSAEEMVAGSRGVAVSMKHIAPAPDVEAKIEVAQ